MISLLAASYYLALHGAALLDGGVFQPSEIVRRDGAIATRAAKLPTGLALAGLDRRPDGSWLFTVEGGGNLDGVDFAGRDIVAYDGAAYEIVFSGGDSGIPEGVGIDALLVDAQGRFVVSFDVPLELAGVPVSEADLVRYDGGSDWSIWWRASDASVPAGTNLAGAALDAKGVLVLGFDGPVEIGGVTFAQGALASRGATGLALYEPDDSWPEATGRADFVFSRGGAGGVPEASQPGRSALLVDQQPDGQLRLFWGAASCGESDDYAVYEGIAGAWNDHAPRSCSTGNDTAWSLVPAVGNTYYLVVARNAVEEGSYGHDSSGGERPPSVAACAPRRSSDSCP